MVGTLLDAVDIDPGWEVAFEAAAGEALTAVVVDDVDVARSALGCWPAAPAAGRCSQHNDGTGPTDRTHPTDPTGPSGRADLGGSRRGGPPSPSGAEPLRRHVRGRSAAVDALLDHLLAGAVRVSGSWSDALTVAVAHPQLVVVTDQGDRFGPQGWRVGTAATGVTGAMLDDARRQVEEATALLDPAANASITPGERPGVAARLNRPYGPPMSTPTVVGRRWPPSSEAEKSSPEAWLTCRRCSTRWLRSRTATSAEHQRLAELEALLPSLEAAEAATRQRTEARAAAEADLDRRRSGRSAAHGLEVQARPGGPAGAAADRSPARHRTPHGAHPPLP
ncbi:MAG: hypothetical protein R2749_26865 [Acidimicrobiales bacterium]